MGDIRSQAYVKPLYRGRQSAIGIGKYARCGVRFYPFFRQAQHSKRGICAGDLVHAVAQSAGYGSRAATDVQNGAAICEDLFKGEH